MAEIHIHNTLPDVCVCACVHAYWFISMRWIPGTRTPVYWWLCAQLGRSDNCTAIAVLLQMKLIQCSNNRSLKKHCRNACRYASLFVYS